MKKLLALLFSVAIIATFTVIPAFAAGSPSGDVVYRVEVTSFSTGSPTTGNYYIVGDTVRLTAAEQSAYTFTGWEIDGDYEIVSGSLNSKQLVVRYFSDIKVKETYNIQNPGNSGSGNNGSGNNGSGNSGSGNNGSGNNGSGNSGSGNNGSGNNGSSGNNSGGFGNANNSDKSPNTGAVVPMGAMLCLVAALTIMVVSKRCLKV